MVYDYIIKNYKEGEPIFFSDITVEGISKPALNQQLKRLMEYGKLMKYETGVYYLPRKTSLGTYVGPTADSVAKYRYISRGNNIDGYYTGNTFANQLGLTTQVPMVVEIASNNTNSSPREVSIGDRRFYIRKPIVKVDWENVYVLQMLDILKNLDIYLDYTYEEARKRFAEYIKLHKIKRIDVDKYIRKYPVNIFKYYYELGLDYVFA